MKLVYFLSVFLVIVFGCKKENSPVKLEAQKLAEEQKNIVNDWKLIKIMTVKPNSQYGQLATMYCQNSLTFSFKSDDVFHYTLDTPCYPDENTYGFWNLAKTDSLFLNFTGPSHIGAYERLEVSKLTADTMKWNILSGYNNGIITQEYTLIPK